MRFRQFISYLLILFCFSIISTPLAASHIVGGEISYKFLSYNADRTSVDYEFTLKLYRDPVGVDYDNFASFGIFEQESWGAWKSYDVIRDVPIGIIEEVPNDIDPCKERNLNEEKLELATYTFQATLEVGDNNYLIAYQKGFRNYTINNVQGGGDIGSVYDILITPEALRNGSSSPHFVGLPPIFICSGFEINIDNSAFDSDGDEIVYSFCTPSIPGPEKTGPGCCGCQNPDPIICLPPYDDINYVTPYSAENPMGSSLINVDIQSGIITGSAGLTGSYVVAVCIEEYRNGILLTKTKRDFEFNVVTCEATLIAQVYSDTYIDDPNGIIEKPIAYFESCVERGFDFINQSVDEQFIKDYKWQFFDETGTLISEESGINVRDFSQDFNAAGMYRGLMILNDNATCFDTAFINVNIVPDISPEVVIDYDTCVAGAVSFMGRSAYILTDIEWNWDLGDGTTNQGIDFLHTYNQRASYPITLEVQDTFGCMEVYSQTLDWFPYELTPPDTIVRDTLLCFSDSLYIYDKWVFQEGTYLNYIPSIYSGCDSIVERIMVDFTNELSIVNEDTSICPQDSYFYNEQWLSEPGIYYDTIASVFSCDSIISLTLSIYAAQYTIDSIGLCESEIYNFGGQLIDSPGSYFDTIPDINSCDSISELRVEVLAEKETYIYDGFCENLFYLYNEEQIFTAGEYEYNYSSVWGCDSTVYLNLDTYDSYSSNQNETICEGGIFVFGGDSLSTGGDYIKIFSSQYGCDSIVVLNLEVTPESNHEYRDTICVGEVYPFGAVNVSIPGLYYDTLTNINGCDSLVVLDLVVGQNLTKINVEDELELDFGESIILEPDVVGGDLISNEWSEIDEVLSYSLELDYLVQNDEWIYFQGTNRLFCVALDSIFIRSLLDIDIYFPNVITPDGDGINDVFNIGASATLANSQLSVYDRWGNLMYEGPKTESRDISTGWDGNYKNEPVRIGTYSYIVRTEFINGEKKIYSGDISVIR